MDYLVTAGPTDVSLAMYLQDPVTLGSATSLTPTGLDLSYCRPGSADVKSDATALAAADAAHSAYGAFELDSTEHPGWYRIDWPDALFEHGVQSASLSVLDQYGRVLNRSTVQIRPVYGFYQLYRGEGGLSGVDFDTPISSVMEAISSKTFTGLGHDANTRYTYVLRPVRLDGNGALLVTPDISCRTEFETDGDTDWLGERPGQVEFIEAQVISGAQIRLRWRYRTPYGGTAPSDFGIYYQATPGITPGSPDTTESYTKKGSYSKTLSLVDGTTYYFAITARTAAGVESHLSNVIGPYIADDTAPDTPTLMTSTTF